MLQSVYLLDGNLIAAQEFTVGKLTDWVLNRR